MRLRSPVARATLLFAIALAAAPAGAREITDAAGRRVAVPEHPVRVMAADGAAAVLVFVLAPQRLIGWADPPTPRQRAFLPAKLRSLPTTGRLSGPRPNADAATVLRLRPDLIIDSGRPTAARVARAAQIQQATGVPYVIFDSSLQHIPDTLRDAAALLDLGAGEKSQHGRRYLQAYGASLVGVGARAEDLANYAAQAIAALRGRLLISPPNERPRVYYGLGFDGLETGLAGSRETAAIDQAGAINVAARLGPGDLVRVTPAQLSAWDPDIIIARERGFYDALTRSPRWAGLKAVRDKRVVLVPSAPFGWIDDPPGVNRLIGLYWLSSVLYSAMYQEDMATRVAEFYDKFYGIKPSEQQIAALLRAAEPPGTKPPAPTAASLLGTAPRLPPIGNAPSPKGLPPGLGTPPGRGTPNPIGVPGPIQ
jgi:iron complex transport system substrate-binding protein